MTQQTWIAAFRSAPVSPYEPTLVHPSRSFDDQTLRQIVRVHSGGDRLRVRFSNLYGKEPLTIARTRIALHATGSAIAPGTDTEVTFGGTPDVTIDAGHEAVSDQVDLATTTETDLVISTYHATPCGLATYHPFALQTGYVAAGDVVSRLALPDPQAVEPRFHLTGIDVLTARRRVVAAFGDSLTDGVGSTPGANLRYTDQLVRRTAAAEMSVISLGIAGNRLLTDVFGESGIARFDCDVLAAPGVTHLVLELGLNDICLPGMLGTSRVSADELIDGYTAIAERARRHGLTTVIATLTPFSGAEAISPGFDNPENEELRQRINRWIRTSGEFDAVADLDQALRDPAAPATLASGYDSGDGIHPNDAGAQAIADVVADALLS